MGQLPMLVLLILLPRLGFAGSCIAPPRPFIPSDSQVVREYGNIIRHDFEDYVQDIQNHFRCLDDERVRAFEEAQIVSQDYDHFLQLVRD